MNTNEMSRSSTMYCVVMGDVINSRDISKETRKQLLTEAEYVFNRINFKYFPYTVSAFGMVRGDAFEGVLFSPCKAPAIIQEIIKTFYSVQKTAVRVSVSIGELSIVSRDHNKSDGQAFWNALKQLDDLRSQNSGHWLQISFLTNDFTQPLIDSQFKLLGALTKGWTDKQREIAWAMDAYLGDKKMVSKMLSVHASVVNKQLLAANYEVYKNAWENLEKFFISFAEKQIENQAAVNENYLAYYNVAVLLRDQGRYGEAKINLERALRLANIEKDLEMDMKALICVLLADVCSFNNEPEKARDFAKKALEIYALRPAVDSDYSINLANKLLA